MAHKATHTAAQYRSSLRASVRGLWQGSIGLIGFADGFFNAIKRGLTDAWYAGAAEAGIQPGELSDAELFALDQTIMAEYQYVIPFGDAILAGSQANGGSIQPFYDRVELWVNTWEGVRQKALQMAAKDQKLRWEYGDTIDHCADCARVAGRVYRASIWAKYGWVPKSRDLACGGWQCDCRFVVTDEPVTPGRPPIMIGHKHIHGEDHALSGGRQTDGAMGR